MSERYDECAPSGGLEDLRDICRDIKTRGQQRQAEAENQIAECFEAMGKAFAVNRRRHAGLIARDVRFHVSEITQHASYSGRKKTACGRWGQVPTIATAGSRQKEELVSRLGRLTNSKLTNTQLRAAANRPYGVAEGDGEGEVLLSFLVVSFLVVSVDDFLVVSFFVVSAVDDFLVVDFFVVEVLAGAFSGAVVDVSVLLVLQDARSPAASMTVME
jgi:hypothetical protein